MTGAQPGCGWGKVALSCQSQLWTDLAKPFSWNYSCRTLPGSLQAAP